VFGFVTKDLQGILSGFHSVIADLEGFVNRVENVASKKLQKATSLKTEAEVHLDEVATAKAVIGNIKALVTANATTP